MRGGDEPPEDYRDLLGGNDPRDTIIQIVLSVLLGLGAFLTFCVLRPRWPSLYAARKRQRNEASHLPELPQSTFGWIPALWRVTEQQVLASAGLDAYVFLRFFRMALKFLTVTLFFALVVIKPVHDAFPEDSPRHKPHNSTAVYTSSPMTMLGSDTRSYSPLVVDKKSHHTEHHYLWMYLVFAYLFTGLAVYLLITETERIIAIRQIYLGNQSTITDRTIRLTGIPPDLRSEEKIKTFIESLQIGKVDNVTLCKNWQELDSAVEARKSLLRKVEESWTLYIRQRRARPDQDAPDSSQDLPAEDAEEDEESRLLVSGSENGHTTPTSQQRRPRATIRYGFLNLQSHHVDAIDYYEEKLRRMDEKVLGLRRESFQATSLAFVTMDSVASCQMAVQAVLDPSPMHLIANLSPAPPDVVWGNTHLSRSRRMVRSWTITVVITILSVLWSIVLVPVAGALNLSSIHKVWPQLADSLESHPLAKSLVTTQLPTLLTTLLFVAVPYLYDCEYIPSLSSSTGLADAINTGLANMQGMISQGDVELSVISKNFFFAFFNYFIVFTLLGTASNFYIFFDKFQNSIKDTTWIANQLATSLQSLLSFYTNLVILQGIGLFPFRLLEVGSVFLYPFYKFWARTPRGMLAVALVRIRGLTPMLDFAELDQPPVFNYGFYLPQVMLIFIICIVYSVLRESWKVLLAGLIYFIIGGAVYKYQLLYAMDHRQHFTGRAWIMICNRMIMGLILFQLTTAGQMALKADFKMSFAILPLLIGTGWFATYYGRTYSPLMRFIALQSITRKALTPQQENADPDGWGETAHSRYEAETHVLGAEDGMRKGSSAFVNPSLVSKLEEVWVEEEIERRDIRPSSSRRRLASTLNAL
ncbi:MAG: hypothetical protein M1828_000042 [Chrysothrix sp. TS-e1954]|nr:MAG: hypothetical protein M1828_000042 [Chrysothrix sp. TS-e1954]